MIRTAFKLLPGVARGTSAGARLALLEALLANPGAGPEKIASVLPRPGHHIVVACMPKSGSTFLAAALTHLTGFRNVTLAYGFEQNEQDLYPPALLRHAAQDTVTQQHMRASDPNVRLVNAFALRPVVLVRNLADIVASYYDHLHKTALKGSQAYINERFFELDEGARVDALIDLVLPWYVSFYVSWFDAEQRAKCPLLWMTYDEATRDSPAALLRVMRHCGLERSRADAERAVAAAKAGDVKLNKGVSGRGAHFLSAAQRARIERLFSHYPWVDFSRIRADAA